MEAKYSHLVQQRSERPRFLIAEDETLNGEDVTYFHFDFPNTNGHIDLAMIIVEDKFIELVYRTNVQGPTLAFIDATVELLKKGGIRMLSSLSVREVENFLRDDNITPSFPNNATEMYRYFEFVGALNKRLTFGENGASISQKEKESPVFDRDYGPLKGQIYSTDAMGTFESLSGDEKYHIVQRVFDHMVRPFLKKDAGDVQCVLVSDTMVVIAYSGACSGCSMSLTTTMNYIEKVLRCELQCPSLMVVTDS